MSIRLKSNNDELMIKLNMRPMLKLNNYKLY